MSYLPGAAPLRARMEIEILTENLTTANLATGYLFVLGNFN